MADDPDTVLVKEDPAIGSLEQRIARARDAEVERSGHRRDGVDTARSSAMNVASTMVGYPIGGIVIGWVLDGVFDTRPWLTIGLMLFAFFCACVQVMRTFSNPASDTAAQPVQD